jgi:hypothetical protein
MGQGLSLYWHRFKDMKPNALEFGLWKMSTACSNHACHKRHVQTICFFVTDLLLLCLNIEGRADVLPTKVSIHCIISPDLLSGPGAKVCGETHGNRVESTTVVYQHEIVDFL